MADPPGRCESPGACPGRDFSWTPRTSWPAAPSSWSGTTV